MTVAAAAVVAVSAVVTPVVVSNAYAEPAKQAAGPLSEVVKGSPIAPMALQHTAAQDSFDALAVAQITEQQVQGRADVTQLDSAIAALKSNYSSDSTTLHKLTVAADNAVTTANKAAVEHDAAVAAAQKAAAEAAAKAAAEAAAAAAALAQVNTPDGARSYAQSTMASSYGWGGDQFSCLNSLWNRESGWNYQAYNPSGATGIPQALPGSKMASVGTDWATDAATQIKWGLGYIAGSYGTPCGAWSHSQSYNWY
ncbi:phospholipase [Planctomonas sp. JC2975]|nr:phospholipase [Planctomonas sp. JC2975]NNC12327.1 phospholipase [Planctomonas sp. JC2975]